MTLLARLRGGPRPGGRGRPRHDGPSEDVADGTGADGQGADDPGGGLGAVVEVRAPAQRGTSRFSRLERAATSVALWVLRVLVIAAGLVGLFYLVAQLWSIVLPVILALILSTVLWPAVKLLRRVMPGALAALVTLLVFLGAIVGIFSFLIPLVVEQATGLTDQVVAGFESLQVSLQDAAENGVLGIGGDQISTWVDDGLQRLQDNAQSIAGSVGSGVVSGLTSVGSALITLLLVLVLTFFFTKDGPRFLPWLHLWSGGGVANHVDELLGRVWRTLGGYIYSQAAVALVDAVFIGLGLLVLGVPFALPLAVLVFFSAFIPIVGAVASGALATLVALVSGGPQDALFTIVIVLVVQQLESNLLQPLLVGKALALHPAVVILSVTAGGTIAGIVGAFLAVPVAAVGTVVLRYVREAVLGDDPATGGGRSPMTEEESEEAEALASRGEDPREAVDTP